MNDLFNRTTMRVHPAADIFPMVADDQLASLVESIKANGLRYQIVIRKVDNGAGEIEDELIDGRNRLRACEIAGVEPSFTVFEGDEDQVRAFIADVNLERRDLKKGQKAALYAKLFPEPAKGGRGKTVTTDNSFTRPQLSNCRAILRHSPALLDDIIADRVPLDAALARVKEEQARASSTEAKIERLRSEAPDLADLVVDDRIKLNEAVAALEQRKAEAAKEEAAKRDTIIRVASAAYTNILALGVPSFMDGINDRLGDRTFRAELLKYMRIEAEQFSSIEDGVSALVKLVAGLKE
jgi:ParB-like chromosome segregation protein Spo0J